MAFHCSAALRMEEKNSEADGGILGLDNNLLGLATQAAFAKSGVAMKRSRCWRQHICWVIAAI
ncbi:hypothetical protein KCP73_07620 [Salmonella enterica subsp. enterica]|nr:hypothetical protein KCP73_07620 [Salmonella enterica subsp. enterica]